VRVAKERAEAKRKIPSFAVLLNSMRPTRYFSDVQLDDIGVMNTNLHTDHLIIAICEKI